MLRQSKSPLSTTTKPGLLNKNNNKNLKTQKILQKTPKKIKKTQNRPITTSLTHSSQIFTPLEKKTTNTTNTSSPIVIPQSKRFFASKPNILDLERNAQLSSDDSHEEGYDLLDQVDYKKASLSPQSLYQMSRSKTSIAKYNPNFNATVDPSWWDYQSFRPNYAPLDTYLAGEKLGQGMFIYVYLC
jgi:hypothetical protein